ncbi:pentapeptide repeat protein [Methyloglobulus morosus KoM1]|uniref:Pentapeptide repeat protein n=1 Tax=Methyloglobulus morosus KoM1 TaxID=1116472 RepID=V5C5X8_9GAMM|nr:pentapeptide repeat-containing protein [Methyloglobulus morosus]ESS72148.1 pentapeptide repeat protein [Methyloglobulus morosus KoM1]
MPNPSPSTSDDASKHIEQLLESANSASQTVAALHVAFLAFVAYLGVIVWGTTHEDLLRISPVKLPILDVELPLTAFYNFVPWMVVLLHFNLLMQLELLSCKLWNLDRGLSDTAAGQQVRDRLFIFPFTHLIAGRSEVLLIRWLMSLVVGISVIALPLAILLAAQIRFLPFHDEAITWSQRLAVWVDAAMLLALWPLIASPKDRAMEWWQNAGFRLLGYWPALTQYYSVLGFNWLARWINHLWQGFAIREFSSRPIPQVGTEPKGMVVLLASVPLIVLLSIIAVIPGRITAHKYYNSAEKNQPNDMAQEVPRYFEDWLIRKVPPSWLSVAAYQYDTVTCTSLPLSEKTEASILQVMLGPCAWFNWGLFPRNLNLRETRLIPKEVPLSLLTRATDANKTIRDGAFKEFDGLNLKNRDLRFADLYGAVLPKADLRHVQLQGAVLLKAKLQGVIGWDKTQLQGAVLGGTQLQGAGLIEADLRDADLRGANLQAADLGWANLQSADLRGADLQAANLQGAKLQGADLRGAKLQGAILREANLQGASLDYAKLQGADLAKADMQLAVLHNTLQQGVDWTQANLGGVFLATGSASEWTERQQNDLVANLKPLMDTEKFVAFQARIKGASTDIKPTILASRNGCYSDNHTLLDCEYRHPQQLETYRSGVLFPKLVALACSDAAIAIGIARRSADVSDHNDPIFGLAGALSKALNSPTPCTGLVALSEQTQENLLKIARQQKSEL